MFHATMHCNLWDLVDEGIDTVLDRLKGEIGITGIAVPLVCPAVEVFRLHKGVSPRRFRSRGGAQFQPNAQHYANTRLRPVVAEWLRKSNPFAQVADACAKRNLRLRAVITCCEAPALVEKYPFAGVKDLFGEPNPDWLCPANADLQEFLCALLTDVQEQFPVHALEVNASSHPLDPHSEMLRQTGSIVLADRLGEIVEGECTARESPQSPDITRSLQHLLAHGSLGAWLMSLCFCESCRQEAARSDIHIAEIQRAALAYLEETFRTGEASHASGEGFLSDTRGLQALIVWRSQITNLLMKRLHSACRIPLLVRRPLERVPSGLEEAIAAHADGLVMLIDEFWAQEAKEVVHSFHRAHGERLPLHICIRAGFLGTGLVSGVSGLVESGAVEVTFDDYSSIPLARVPSVKQAVRKAQRDSG